MTTDSVFAREVVSLINEHECTSIVETGTYCGDTTRFLALEFPDIPVFTCEINGLFYAKALARLKDVKNVTAELSDSTSFLAALAASGRLGARPFFYLDAHWYENNPLRDELSIIIAAGFPSVVVIHDFEVPGRPEFGFDAGLNVEAVADLLPSTTLVRFPSLYHKDIPLAGPLRGRCYIIAGY